ncbi:MAG TPA: alpha-amylase family glycosyl hydrolase [Candidatus Cybelea sp.]|nr:alpha-amylase family glycosyl hydrolase [Candidatus Cybelea sp.]
MTASANPSSPRGKSSSRTSSLAHASSSTKRSPKSPEPLLLRSHPHLYEIDTWAWLEELSARLGRKVTLADVPNEEWDALADRGFDIVWLMGVWQRSAESRRISLEPANTQSYATALPGWTPADVIGSPYAVAAYKPDPRMGSFRDIDGVRKKLHARKMALLLDFVGNHTAVDHPWTREHPDFYVQGTQEDYGQDPASFYRLETKKGPVFLALARDPYFPPWQDVAQLNHFHLAMRQAQLDDLRTIAQHCDGVRCDMAMLQLNDIFARVWARLVPFSQAPPTEFWTEAKAAVPKLTLLAESYWGTEERLLSLGFSFAYDKELYDAVRDAAVGRIRERLALPVGMQSCLARFLENHDEARCAVTFGGPRLQALATLMSTLPGMRFYHHGELEGRKIRQPIALSRMVPEPPDPATASLFQTILRVTNEAVFHGGRWNLLPVISVEGGTSESLLAYEWRLDEAWKMIVANLSAGTAQGHILLGDRVSSSSEYVLNDELNDARYPRPGQELQNPGLFVRLDGFRAHLFDIRPGSAA